MTVQMEIIETADIEQKSGELVTIATDFEVVTQEDYAKAASIRKDAKAQIAIVKKRMADPKKKAKAAHSAICDLEKELMAPPKHVVEIVDVKMLDWNAEQDRIRAAAQAEAEDKAREEAERIQADRLLEAIADGDDEETIAEIAATPVIIAPETVVVPMPTGTGSTRRKTWKGEVTDFTALVKAVADGTAPLSFLQPNQSELDAHARMTKAESTIPGYRAYEKASMAGTR